MDSKLSIVSMDVRLKLSNSSIHGAIIVTNPSHVILRSVLPDPVFLMTQKYKSIDQLASESNYLLYNRQLNSQVLKASMPVDMQLWASVSTPDCSNRTTLKFGHSGY